MTTNEVRATGAPPGQPVNVVAIQRSGRQDGHAVEDLPDSEDALALQFVGMFEDQYRWTPGMGWMHRGPTRWLRDDSLQRFDDVRGVVRLRAELAPKVSDKIKIASAKTVNAVVSLSQSDRRIVLPATAWDADPDALNHPAGITDLRSGATRTRWATDYVTQVARIAPDFEAAHPVWSRFLDDVFRGDREVIEFMQRLCGYCLTAHRSEQKLFFCYGLGANGKSTFWDFFMWLQGGYAMKLPAQVLMQSKLQGHPTEIAQLHLRRLAVSSELEEGQYWAEARIKELTGDEVMRARFMRMDFFEFAMTQKHVILGNFKPRLKGGDHALARRFVLVPFLARFDGKKRDPHMLDKLRTEAAAVMAWAIRGAVKWHAEGMAIPASVAAASAEYMAENDDLLQWIDERCYREGPCSAGASKLYEDYTKWLRARGQQSPSMKLWGERMSNLDGITKDKKHGVMVYAGIELKPAPPVPGPEC